MHILFVCTGNICRSPTAERLAIAHGTGLEIPDFTASSAGVQAVVGHPIHRRAAAVLESLGGDPSDFAARQLTPRIAAGADLILTMTTEHRDAVLEIAPRHMRRTFTLVEAARLATALGARTIDDLAVLRAQLPSNELRDVPDPIGQSPEFFASVGSRIADLLPAVLELCRNSSRSHPQ